VVTTDQEALAAGAQSIQAPVQQEGETDRRAGLQLPTGTTFWLATQVG
jgi:hypothetical protein